MKLLYITPHLSTGGCPQYLLKKIKDLNDVCEIYCIEYANITGGVLVVQRTQIQEILGEKLITLGENKEEIIDYIKKISPDVIHFEELPEYFCERNVCEKIYCDDRNYKIIETSHDSSFNPEDKLYFPDKFAFVSEYQKQIFSKLDIPSEVIEYPIEYKTKTDRVSSLNELSLDPNKIHILNIGLFTPRKNQAEIINYAMKLINYPVQFHFIGNQADNFKWYWEPLMKNFPINCKWWGERKDVDKFYNAMDAFLFTSKGTNKDKETNPLVVRESIGWNIPLLMYNLPVYCGMYNSYKNITWLKENFGENLNLIKNFIEKNLQFKSDSIDVIDTKPKCNDTFDNYFNVWFEKETNKIFFNYQLLEEKYFNISIKDVDSTVPIYHFNSNFLNRVSWWTLPIPKHVFDFENERTFRGFLIEIYDKDGNFVCSKELIIKNENTNKVKIDLKNPFDCLFFNYYEMFVYNRYDSYNLNEKDVIIDIGANAGLFTKLCLSKGVKKIYSIEPNKKSLLNLNYLFKNDNRVTVIDKAIHSKSEKIKLYSNSTNSTITSIDKNHILNEGLDVEETEVDTITIDELIINYNLDHISMIKMDIEGAEYAVFDKIDQNIFKKIDSFLIEFHDNINGKIELIINKLKNNGYYIDQIRLHGKNNESIIDDYLNHVNGTIYAVKQKNNLELPKIKAVHLQTTLDDEREKLSRSSLEILKDLGINLVLHKNEVYTSLPPTHNCNRPFDVSLTKLNDNSLTPAHYGCYESFKLGILTEFDDDLDFIMLCEGDCLIEVDSKEFKSTLLKVCEIMNKEKIDYFSFGDFDTLQFGIRQSNVVYIPENQELCYVTDRIIGLQCILFSKNVKRSLFEYLRTAKWDAADIYFNNMAWNLNIKRGILNKRITTQCDGMSLIDKEFKKFIKK